MTLALVLAALAVALVVVVLIVGARHRHRGDDAWADLVAWHDHQQALGDVTRPEGDR
jgi:hypothetical protein